MKDVLLASLSIASCLVTTLRFNTKTEHLYGGSVQLPSCHKSPKQWILFRTELMLSSLLSSHPSEDRAGRGADGEGQSSLLVAG